MGGTPRQISSTPENLPPNHEEDRRLEDLLRSFRVFQTEKSSNKDKATRQKHDFSRFGGTCLPVVCGLRVELAPRGSEVLHQFLQGQRERERERESRCRRRVLTRRPVR